MERRFKGLITLPVIDEKWGQSYVIVTESKEEDIDKKIKELLEENVARYKMPKLIIKLEKLPKSSLGKVIKRELYEAINFEMP